MPHQPVTVITAIGTPVHGVAQLAPDLSSLQSQTSLNLPFSQFNKEVEVGSS